MDVLLDPDGHELAALLAAAGDLAGKRVLEVGCGDGRVTWLYADQAAQVVAIDPDEESIVAAREATPERLKGRVAFAVGEVEQFAAGEPFDLVILSWSL